jgi:hypothetical protein
MRLYVVGLILLSFSLGRNHFNPRYPKLVTGSCDWLLAATQREEDLRLARDTRERKDARQKRSRHTLSGSPRDTRDGQRRPRVTLATPGDARHTRD